jgi:hypothetical protein
VKSKALFTIGFLTLLTCSPAVLATDEQIVTFGVSADYYSKYIWRGQVLDDKSVLQPAASISAYGFTGSLWGNMNLADKDNIVPDNAGEFSEFDWTLDYTAVIPGIEWLTGSVGVIYYRFPNQSYDPTTEIYGGLSLPNAPLTPYFKWYRDVDEIKGSYFQFGLGHTIEKVCVMSEDCSCDLQLGASFGWGNTPYNVGYFGVDGGHPNDLAFTVGLPVSIGSWTVKPSINYAAMLSDSIREATDKSDNFWWGVGISTRF